MSNIVWSPTKGWHDGPALEVKPSLRRASTIAVGQMHRIAAAPPAPPINRNGRCLSCGAIETQLNRIAGYEDLSSIGESERYPVGYGCELCS